ncbi:MAG: hypothetical protein QMC95_16725 [Desulfitobacteriaceae bacterium]|nr:hypothetical protein [Desulfitobacteriaceae bacterium]MDI6915834.1 hypothetical protein [Desulfitobacteriaceae bacterium]
MDIISLAITAFVIYSLYTAFKEKNAGRSPGRQNPPWMRPPAPTPRRERFEEKPSDLWLENKPPLWADPYKDKEVAEAEGQEGVWGDEGRVLGTEGTQGVEGTPGSEGVSVDSGKAGTSGGLTLTEVRHNGNRSSADELSLTIGLSEGELVQGIIWAEILGKPRALRRFHGPRA